MHVAFRDNRDARRRVVAFTDKSASTEMGRKIEKLVALVGAGERPDPQLARWIEAMPPHVRDKLSEWGLINDHMSAASMTLAVTETITKRNGRKALKLTGGHLHDWRETLLAKGVVARDVRQKVERARLVFEGTGARFWGDITPSKVELYLASIRERGVSAETRNHYLGSAKQFAAWMVADRRAAENPLGHLKAINTKTDRRHDRRALSTDELARLIRAAEAAPRRIARVEASPAPSSATASRDRSGPWSTGSQHQRAFGPTSCGR